MGVAIYGNTFIDEPRPVQLDYIQGVKDCCYFIHMAMDEKFIYSFDFDNYGNTSYQQYCENQRRINSWIDHQSLRAIHMMLEDTDVVIYRANELGQRIPPTRLSKYPDRECDVTNTIFLLLLGSQSYNTGHYNVLFPMDRVESLSAGLFKGVYHDKELGQVEIEYLQRKLTSAPKNSGVYKYRELIDSMANWPKQLKDKSKQTMLKMMENDNLEENDKEYQHKSLKEALFSPFAANKILVIEGPLSIESSREFIDILVQYNNPSETYPKNESLRLFIKICRVSLDLNCDEMSILIENKIYKNHIIHHYKDIFESNCFKYPIKWKMAKKLLSSKEQIPNQSIKPKFKINCTYDKLREILPTLTIRQIMLHPVAASKYFWQGCMILLRDNLITSMLEYGSDNSIRPWERNTSEWRIGLRYNPKPDHLATMFQTFWKSISLENERPLYGEVGGRHWIYYSLFLVLKLKEECGSWPNLLYNFKYNDGDKLHKESYNKLIKYIKKSHEWKSSSEFAWFIGPKTDYEQTKESFIGLIREILKCGATDYKDKFGPSYNKQRFVIWYLGHMFNHLHRMIINCITNDLTSFIMNQYQSMKYQVDNNKNLPLINLNNNLDMEETPIEDALEIDDDMIFID